MTSSWPDHLLSMQEWEALPEDPALRVEVAEGVLFMPPRPVTLHQRAVMRLGYRVDEQLPPELTALIEVEVVLSYPPLTIRVPDVVVARTSTVQPNPARLTAADLLVAVEVLSDGTRRVDRVLKFSEYADAGIAQYWIVDLDGPVTLSAYVSVDGTYELSGEHTGTAVLDVAGHPVTVDLDALTGR